MTPDALVAALEQLQQKLELMSASPLSMSASVAAQLRECITELSALLGRIREEAPKSWECFHCGEVFTDRAEATEHFGSDEHKVPACRLSADDVRQLRALEQLNAKLERECANLENDARLWYESNEDRQRRIGNRQWWQALDYLEGEKLVLQEKVAALEAARPLGADAPKDKMDELHQLLTRHGIANYTEHRGLVTDPIHFFAKWCKESQPQLPDPAQAFQDGSAAAEEALLAKIRALRQYTSPIHERLNEPFVRLEDVLRVLGEKS